MLSGKGYPFHCRRRNKSWKSEGVAVPNPKYRKGAAFERKVKHWLEANGWWVCRSAGSKGVADLVAIRDGKVLLVQCKLSPKNIGSAKKELDALCQRLKVQGAVVYPTIKNKRAHGITFLKTTTREGDVECPS